MGDVVPGRIGGRYFSRRRQWGILSAVPAVLAVGWLLDHRAGDTAAVGIDSVQTLLTLRWCAVIFLCAAVFGLGWLGGYANALETLATIEA